MSTAIHETRTAPDTAFRAPAGRVQFAEGGDGAAGKPAKVSVVARSGDPIDHWYWGRIVHDFGGLRVNGDKIPFDWCHWSDEILGYADRFDTASGDLVVTGELVPFEADDRASEILHKGQRGVPYEASIYFDPQNGLRLEWLPEKMTALVNGRQVVGPCVIVREWLLRGVALCPYGADPNTSTEFAKRTPSQIEITLFSTEGDMSKSNPAPADTEKQDPAKMTSEQPPANPPVPANPPAADRAQFTEELKRYVAKFGAENGAKWLSEGKTFAEACELHIAAQAEQLAAKDRQLADAAAKLAAVNVGEQDPVSFGSGEKKDQPPATAPTKFDHLGSNLAKFASSIKLPTK